MTDEEIRDQMSDMAASVAQQTANGFMGELKGYIDERFVKMQAGQMRIEERLDVMSARILGMETRMVRVESRLDTLEVGQNEIKLKLDRVTEDHETRIVALETKVH